MGSEGVMRVQGRKGVHYTGQEFQIIIIIHCFRFPLDSL